MIVNLIFMSEEKSPIALCEEKYPETTKEFKKILKEQYEVFCRKQLNYGPDNISVGSRLETSDEIKVSFFIGVKECKLMVSLSCFPFLEAENFFIFELQRYSQDFRKTSFTKDPDLENRKNFLPSPGSEFGSRLYVF